MLDDSPGVFAAVTDHPATIRALTTAHRELRDISDAALDAIGATSRLHASLIDLHRTAAPGSPLLVRRDGTADRGRRPDPG